MTDEVTKVLLYIWATVNYIMIYPVYMITIFKIIKWLNT